VVVLPTSPVEGGEHLGWKNPRMDFWCFAFWELDVVFLRTREVGVEVRS
jgi:hypothetical protein